MFSCGGHPLYKKGCFRSPLSKFFRKFHQRGQVLQTMGMMPAAGLHHLRDAAALTDIGIVQQLAVFLIGHHRIAVASHKKDWDLMFQQRADMVHGMIPEADQFRKAHAGLFLKFPPQLVIQLRLAHCSRAAEQIQHRCIQVQTDDPLGIPGSKIF